MSGYVLLHRDLLGNPQFRGKDDEYAAIWLVARAAWDETTVRVNREPVMLQRGQCAYAISFLAEAWECSKTTAHSRVRHLESCGFIRTQAERGYTIITVCKYNDYQIIERSDRTQADVQDERQPNEDRTNKKEGNESNEDSSSLRSEGAEDAPEDEVNLSAEIWSKVLDWLVKATDKPKAKLRPVLGKWVSEVGEVAVIAICRRCAASGKVEPISWIEKELKEIRNGKTEQADSRNSEAFSDELLRRNRERAQQRREGLAGDLAGNASPVLSAFSS